MSELESTSPLGRRTLTRRRVLRTAGVAGAGAASLAFAGQAWAASTTTVGHLAQLDSKAGHFHDAMRKLWEDHITWTRLFIVSDLAGLPDLNQTASRLLRNQADIGAAIAPFYGTSAGAKLADLLRSHILIAGQILTAARSGSQGKVQDALARWHANADDIATFLSGANPKHWPLDEMKMMMKEHLDLTLAEALARLRGDFAADVAAYDRIHVQILGMADMLSSGIIAQFPERFGGKA